MEPKKQRLIVDMDGVMADVYEQFISLEEKEFGNRQLQENVLGKTEYEAFVNAPLYVTSDGFFRNAPLMEGAVDAIKLLNEKYELFIVSAAMEFPKSLPEKLQWLAEHFPFLTWHQLVFCGSKAVVQGDIMIDDHFRNLDVFKGRTLLFTQPHNFYADTKTHTRVNSWSDVLSLLV